MSLAKNGIYSVFLVAMLCVVGFAVISDSDDVSADAGTYTIEYEVDGKIYSFSGTEKTVILKGIEDIGAKLSDGMKFTGWKYSDMDITVAIGSSVTLKNEPTRFVAQTDVVKYTVTFKSGDDVLSTQEGAYNSNTVMPADPLKEGYTFEGWDIAVSEKIVSDATYTAIWKKVYNITWIVDGVTIAYGDVVDPKIPSDPVKDSFRFLGWYSDKGLNFTSNFEFSADTVFTALFAAEVFTVTFVFGDDKKAFITETVSFGDKAIKPAGLPEGYGGWEWDFNTPITGDKIIFAVSNVPDPGMSTSTMIVIVVLGFLGVCAIAGFGYLVKTGKINLKRKS
ncbi:MAG: InlB B-repeat-containing protein [Clostridia bacterium]